MLSYKTTSTDFLVSSNPASGAKNINSLGSQFDVVFDKSYVYDEKARSIKLEILESEMYYNTHNIDNVRYNNYRIRIDGPNLLNVVQSVIIVIPNGLYTPQSLNSSMQLLLNNAGFQPNMIQITGNDPINRIQITFNFVNASVHFNNADYHGFADLLGYGYIVLAPAVVGEIMIAPNLATFNKTNFYIITSNITSDATIVNGQASHAIARILINSAPNYQIQDSPAYPYTHTLTHLRGTSVKRLTFQLRDDSGELINTQGELWSMRYRLTYEYN